MLHWSRDTVGTAIAGGTFSCWSSNVSGSLLMQVVSRHDYSKAADVYSFGIILWEMMTWRLPWDDLNPFQVSHLI